MRWRQTDALERIAAMQLFKTSFSNDIFAIKHARAAVMNLVDLVNPIKSKFVQAAMGTTGKLPELAKCKL